MAKTNKTKYALLGMLSLNPGSGYDIKKMCDNSISHFWNENYGHIYPVLNQMEKEGLVTRKSEHTKGKPSKNTYSITHQGKEELNEWLMLPCEESHLRIEVLLKLFFSEQIPIENTIKKIQDEKEKWQNLSTKYKSIKKHLTTDIQTKNDKNLQYWLYCLDYGEHMAQATIKWADNTISSIKKSKVVEKKNI